MHIKPELIISAFRSNNYDVNKTASQLGIHKVTVYRWITRSKTPWTDDGLSSKIKRKSTKPHVTHNVLSGNNKADIINLRKSKCFCAEKIKYQLNLNVSKNTIHRFLKKSGLINKYGNHIRPRYQKTTHMYLKNTKTIGFLQMDVKYITPELSGLPWTCYQYAIIDIFSRYKDAVILNDVNQDNSTLALIEIVNKLPFKPTFIQTDNGFEFQSRFAMHAKALGLDYHYIHKSSPNENAVIERSFRTDEDEFFFRLEEPCKDYDDLRLKFADYLLEYNTVRPHLGISLKTPMEVVANVMRH